VSLEQGNVVKLDYGNLDEQMALGKLLFVSSFSLEEFHLNHEMLPQPSSVLWNQFSLKSFLFSDPALSSSSISWGQKFGWRSAL